MTAFTSQFGTTSGPVALSTVGNTTLSGSTLVLGWAFFAESTDAITKVRFRYGARTGTPPTYVITLESLDASGNPDGVDLGGGSPTATTFTPPASTAWDGTIREITLTNSYTPSAANQVIAVTIRHSGGSVDASNCSSFTRGFTSFIAANAGFPRVLRYNGAAWATGETEYPCCAFVHGSTVTGAVILSAYTTATAATSGHRTGMFFTIPSGVATSVRVSGMMVTGRAGASASSGKYAIWNNAGTVLASTTIDTDWHVSPTTTATRRIVFDAPVDLAVGTKYFCGVESAGSTVSINGLNVQTSDEMQQFPNGANQGLATFNGLAWTETATTYPLIELLFSDVTAPSGGGGAIILGGLGRTGIGSF